MKEETRCKHHYIQENTDSGAGQTQARNHQLFRMLLWIKGPERIRGESIMPQLQIPGNISKLGAHERSPTVPKKPGRGDQGRAADM